MRETTVTFGHKKKSIMPNCLGVLKNILGGLQIAINGPNTAPGLASCRAKWLLLARDQPKTPSPPMYHGVCVERPSANFCSSRVTADKISSHLFAPPTPLAVKRGNLPGSLLRSSRLEYEPADGL